MQIILKMLDSALFWIVIAGINFLAIDFLIINEQKETLQNNKTAFMKEEGLKCRIDNYFFYVHSKNGWKLKGENTYKEDTLIPLSKCVVLQEENRDE